VQCIQDDDDDLAFLKELQEQAEAQRLEDEKLGATVDYSAAKGKKEETTKETETQAPLPPPQEQEEDDDL
jgi:hypothetical protein